MTSPRTASRAAAVLVLSALIAGCSTANDTPQSDTQNGASTGLPADHPPLTAPQSSASAMVGVVLEQMDGGGYTYARVQINGDEIWTAGPITSLSEGDTIGLLDAFPMEQFRSNALDRTFELLYFVGGYRPASAMTAAPPVPAGSAGVVLQVLNGGGYTYLEVETEEAATWIAADGMEVTEGDRVVWGGASVMRQFTSSTLNRTFDEILFVTYVEVIK